MAQAPKKHRIQIKVFDVDSGQELSSHEHIIPVNGGYCCCCTTHYCVPGCIMVQQAKT